MTIRKFSAAATAVAALLAFVPGAQAASIGLFNTGVDATGVSRSDGSTPDLHYTLNGGSLPTVVGTSTGGFPIGPWLGDSNDSAWIAPLSDARFAGANGATFDYQTTFDLTGLNPLTAAISGRWSTDDQGVNILINGVPTGQTTPPSSYASWTSFVINSGFVNGINTLDFLVFNTNADCCGYPAGTNPTGVRVEFTSVDTAAFATPLPAALPLFAGGLGVLGLLSRRRKKKAAMAA